MVSCHMDLKPENLLFDGRRAWLIDWQAAHVNDRYFDLAVVANFLARSEGEERTLLERYFGHPAGEWARARFHLMRQVVHMLSAAVFLMLGSAGKGVEPGVEPPPFREFHDRVWGRWCGPRGPQGPGDLRFGPLAAAPGERARAAFR